MRSFSLHRVTGWLNGPRGAALAFVMLHAAWLATHLGGDRWRVMIADAFFAPGFLVIALFARRAARAYSDAARRTGAPDAAQSASAWYRLAAAYGALWISNLVWFWSDLRLGATVEPVAAQGLDALAYVLLIAGLLRFPMIRGDRAMRRRVILDLLTVAVGAALVTWYVLIRPRSAHLPGAGLGDLGAFITALGHVAVIVAVSALVFRHGLSRDRQWLRLLAVGHLASCIASLVGGVLQIDGTYLPGAPVDALWMVGDLLIFLAAYDAGRQAVVFEGEPAPASSARHGGWAATDLSLPTPVRGIQLWLPYVFSAAAFGVLLVATSGEWSGPVGIVVAANALVLLLVALRQELAFKDSVTLSRAHLMQEQRFRSLVQFSSDLITVIDRTGTIVYQSPAVERVLGYSALSTMGTSVLRLLHPDEHARFGQQVRSALVTIDAAAGESLSQNWRLGSGRPSIWRLRHSAGRYVWVESVATALASEPGSGMLVINTRDVTERVLLEAELRSAQKMEAVGRLAGGIAHDFNNLLTSVRVNAALLRPPELEPGVPELDEIEAAVERAASLTRQLLTFSRRQVIQTQRLELGEVIRGLEPLIRRLLGPSVQLHVIAEGACWLEADPGQLEQIVMNLAVNSREAMPTGGALSLFVTTSEVSLAQARREPGLLPGAYVDLVVEDTGRGMSAETLTHVFEPFFTTKDGGGGLGLSTVFGIATQMGGHVTVQSTVGKGTRFDVRLPRLAAASVDEKLAGDASAATEARGEVIESRPRAAVPSGRGEVVLIVDDEETVRRSLQRILVRHGYEALVAGDGVEALEIEARTDGPIHLLLTDVMMPRMDGRELMHRFLARRPDTAVVCMSGYVDDTLRESLPLDDCSFLAKPFSVAAVIELVQQELEAKRAV